MPTHALNRSRSTRHHLDGTRRHGRLVAVDEVPHPLPFTQRCFRSHLRVGLRGAAFPGHPPACGRSRADRAAGSSSSSSRSPNAQQRTGRLDTWRTWQPSTRRRPSARACT